MNLDECGDVLTREQAMAVYLIPSVKALYRRVAANRFPPPAMTYPARWFKADLERWMAGESRLSTRKSLRRSA